MSIKYKLTEIYPCIFHCTIEDSYDLAMTFCRVQEFYESPYKQIRGKVFNLLEFMSLYAKDHDNVFTYPQDWGGFNIPGDAVYKLYKTNILNDFNSYDLTVIEMYDKIKVNVQDNKFYLIASQGDEGTIHHEVAHGLYYLDQSYREYMDKLTYNIPSPIYKEITEYLLNLGYTKEVLLDEVQAYLSTGYRNIKSKAELTRKQRNELDVHARAYRMYLKPFIKNIKQ